MPVEDENLVTLTYIFAYRANSQLRVTEWVGEFGYFEHDRFAFLEVVRAA